MKIALKPLADQVVVITGASSGIGLVTARLAAERGASVFLIARNGDALAKIAGEIEEAGGAAGYSAADVADEAALRRAAAAAIARFGRIDTWVNNAGVAIYASLMDTPEDDHQRLFQTNYFGVVHGARAAVEHLRPQGGALVTVASIVSDIPSPIMGAYAASKHAVKGFIGSLRIEATAAGWPIAITLIKPSGIDTPIAEHAANRQEGEALIPPPVYDPLLVAEAILDAAQTPRRDVSVGGAGRLQVLFGEHFPALLDRLAIGLIPTLQAPKRAKTPGNNLAAAQRDGAERSRAQSGRTTSLYAVASRHRPAAIGAGLLALGAATWLMTRRGTAS